MKPIKKSTLFLLIYIILGVVSTFLSIKYIYSTQYDRSTAVNLIPTKSLGVILPIEIKGKVFHFLWDTGSSHSSISQQAVDSIEMDSTIQKKELNSLNSEKNRSQYLYERASLKLGDFEIIQSLHINNDKNQEVDGILGEDIIGKYSWSFDFLKDSVTISKKKQTIQIGAMEQLYELELITSETSPYCKITINDTIQDRFLFNSGCLGIGVDKESLMPDLFFALWDNTDLDSVHNYLKSYSNKISERISLYSGGREFKGYFLKDVKTGGYLTPTSFVVIQIDSSFRKARPSELSFGTKKEIRGIGVITCGFMRRFDRVYFDPKHKKFSLIKSSEQPDRVTESINGVLKLVNFDSLNCFIR